MQLHTGSCTALWLSVFGFNGSREAGYRFGEKIRFSIVGPDTPNASPISGHLGRLFGAADQLVDGEPDAA